MSAEGTKTETPGHREITPEQKAEVKYVRQEEANMKEFLKRVQGRVPKTDPLSGESPARNIARAISALEDCVGFAVRGITGGPILPAPDTEGMPSHLGDKGPAQSPQA